MFKKSLFYTFLFSQLLTSASIVFASGGPSAPSGSDEEGPSGSVVASQYARLVSSENLREWQTLNRTWYMDGEQQAQRRVEMNPFLLTVAQNAEHPQQWIALNQLWNSGGELQAGNRAVLQPLLLGSAQNSEHPHHWNSVVRLWTAEGAEQIQNRAAVRPALVQIAQTRKCFSERANTAAAIVQRDAIRYLRENNDPADQELGSALQLQYLATRYPDFVYSANLRMKIAAFNQETFRAHAREPLADLSAEEMDIVGEMNALMNQINPTDERSPLYLQVAAITGQEDDASLNAAQNAERLRGIQQRVRGFLKFLTGQPLEEGEEAGWQMYEEHKPALINALKHIINALNREEDPQARLNNLGIVLNGILYCPTGQAEGINSAVNTLIYGHNRLAGSFEERLHVLVQEATYQTFLNAFHHEGGVHNIARARMVLKPHIGISQALGGFEERISQVSAEEIPEILEDFYKFFTSDSLATYLLNQVQSTEDLQRVLASIESPSPDLRRRIEQDQKERPLLGGAIVRWLVDQGQQERLADFGFDAEGNGTLSHEGALEILRTLGYLRG